MARLDLDGRTLGEFTLREKIGEGGFAVVHRAEQSALGREAVVKVLHSRFATTPEVAQRFLREARLASRIDHPYAAHVYAFGAEADGLLWIAMELVRGTPMDKLLEQGPLSLEQLVPLFERICEVVQNAHDHGIVHRDLKPGNVMVMTRGGRLLPKLLDFGIARALDDVEPVETASISTAPTDRPIDPRATTAWVEVDRGGTRRGQVMGSPSYMAPEQWIDAGSVGPATDIYALGVLAFQALSGRVPYSGTMANVRASHLEAAPPVLGAKFPPAIDALLARALAKKPLDRYTTATELAAAMRAAAGFEDGALPQLPPAIRDAALAHVQPIAEAVAALDGARNLDQGAALISDVATVAIRWLAIVALASRTNIGAGTVTDSEATRDKLRRLGRGRLDDASWFALARELTRPFEDKRSAYPVPALIELLHGELPAALARLRELQDQLRSQRTERRVLYGDAITALARVLDLLGPIAAYAVIVPRAGRAERWCGVRRQPRTTAAFAGTLVDGRALLVDRDGAAVLQLAPLVQIAIPAPGRDLEMFVFDGKGTRSARLVAMPAGFERSDPALDDWLRAELGNLDEPAATVEADSPYRGLAPFTEEFADFYVGREPEVEAFVNRLIAEPLLAVVGPSGAGKSSFIQAGVLPELPAQWRAIIVRPGASPIAALEAHLQAAGVEARGLREDPGTLAEALRDAAGREGATLVLVIDQLEELFTLCKDDRERATFAAAIADATRTELDPFRVVVTLRDDFLIRAAGLPVLGDRLARGLQLLAVPAPDELERIVVEPARRAGFELDDPALATEMVDAVATQPGALALLSFTAAELWKLRDRHFRQLTRKAYSAIGGVAGALAKHAEATLSELSTEDQRLVRIAFRHLVTVDGTRQVLTVDELHQLLRTEQARAQTVVDRLIAARLLVASEDTGGVARIEIIHEALLAAWPRLVDWRREDAEGARLRDQLRIAARQWDSRGRPRGLLWRDDALAEYRIWRARHPGMMTDLEEAFGLTSLDAERRSRRVRRTLLIAAFLVLGGGAVVLFQLRSQAQSQREDADVARKHADEQRAVAEGLTHEMVLVNAESVVEQDPTTALGWLERYPIAAPNWDRVRELALLAQYRGPARHVLEVREPRHLLFTRDDSRLITAGDQQIQTWDPRTGALLGTITHDVKLILDNYGPMLVVLPDGSAVAFTDETGRVWIAALPAGRPQLVMTDRNPRLAVSSDGRWLAAAGSRVQLYELATKQTTPLDGATGEIYALVFSPDGSRLVTGADDGTIRAWELAARANRLVLRHPKPIYNVDISADGKIAFAAENGMFLMSGDIAKPLHGAFVMAPQFTPDGRAIVALDSTGPRMWSPTGTPLPLAVPRGDALDSRFGVSADRRTVVFSTPAGAHVVDLTTGVRRELVGGRSVLGAAISNGGTRIAVIGSDYLVRIWEIDHDLSVLLDDHSLDVMGIDLSPDDRFVATASDDTTVTVTELATRRSTTLRGHDGGVQTVAFSRDGTKLLVSPNTTVKIWDLATSTAISLVHPTTVIDARLSRDASRLFTLCSDDKLRIWEVATRAVRELSQPKLVAFDISPDETRVVVATSDGRVVLWDLATGTSRDLGRHDRGDAVGDVRFLPDGKSVASRGGRDSKFDHSVRVWNLDGSGRVVIASREVLRTFAISSRSEIAVGTNTGTIRIARRDGSVRELIGHTKTVRNLAFSPDGTLLISSSNDATVRVWRLADGASQLVQRHRGAIRQVVFSADGTLVGSASDDHTAWVGTVHPERFLGTSPRELAQQIGALTSVRIDRIGVAHLATTPTR